MKEKLPTTGFVPYIDQFGKKVGFFVEYPTGWDKEKLNTAVNKMFSEGKRKPVFETIVFESDYLNATNNIDLIAKKGRPKGSKNKT